MRSTFYGLINKKEKIQNQNVRWKKCSDNSQEHKEDERWMAAASKFFRRAGVKIVSKLESGETYVSIGTDSIY